MHHWNRRKLPGNRHGFAMLLVIISLAVVTVSTTAFLAGRAARPEISENVVKSSLARAGAETGLDMAISLMRNNPTTWRDKLVNCALIQDYSFGDGKLGVYLMDKDANAPTADTHLIYGVSIARYDKLQQVAVAAIKVPAAQAGVDVDLSEFAVFSGSTFLLDNHSAILPWRVAPQCTDGLMMRVGTNSTNSGVITLQIDVHISNGVYYVRSGASTYTINNNGGMSTPPRRAEISDSAAIPTPDGPTPITSGLPLALVPALLKCTGSWSLSQSRQYISGLITDYADIVLDGPGMTVLVNTDLTLDNGGDIVVNAANVNLVVLGNLYVGSESSISIRPGASLNLFVGGRMTVDDGVLGLPDEVALDSTRDAERELQTYVDPSRCRVYKVPGTPAADWEVKSTGFACARLYGIGADVSVDNHAAVYGSVTGDSVTVKNHSRVFYDPAFDRREGYTNADSLIYTGDGEIDPDILAMLTDLNDSTLESIQNYVDSTASKDPARRDWQSITYALLQLSQSTLDADSAIPTPILTKIKEILGGTGAQAEMVIGS